MYYCAIFSPSTSRIPEPLFSSWHHIRHCSIIFPSRGIYQISIPLYMWFHLPIPDLKSFSYQPTHFTYVTKGSQPIFFICFILYFTKVPFVDFLGQIHRNQELNIILYSVQQSIRGNRYFYFNPTHFIFYLKPIININLHFHIIILQLSIGQMSISQVKANEAKLFMANYRDAIKILQSVAKAQKLNNEYDSFLSQTIEQQKVGLKPDGQLLRKIRLFQFSHYYYLKYFQQLNSLDLDLGRFTDLLRKVKNL